MCVTNTYVWRTYVNNSREASLEYMVHFLYLQSVCLLLVLLPIHHDEMENLVPKVDLLTGRIMFVAKTKRW